MHEWINRFLTDESIARLDCSMVMTEREVLKSLKKKPKKESLMRKQIERCYCCGKIGHKARRWQNAMVQFYGKGKSSVMTKVAKS